MTLQIVLDELIQSFQNVGLEQPAFEARQLVQDCLHLSFAQLLSQPEREISAEALNRLHEWRDQRLAGVPLAYLSGHKGFYKYEFLIEPGVLIPRPETELVVETALRRIEDRSSMLTMADLGCGSGCIGLSLISELSELHLWGVDVSQKACEMTWRNAVELGVESRVKLNCKRVEDWSPGLNFDLIVANPPYIAPSDLRVEPHVRKYEPHEALFAGEDGLEAFLNWIPWARRHLSPKGIFVCELGAGQSRVVQDMLARNEFDQIQSERDLAGHERVVSAIKRK